ncbi:MAG: hypothetical protein QM758_20725 [Armatimonas sp.]
MKKMQITNYTLRYTERRSVNYQSIEVSAEATVEIGANETIDQAHQLALKHLVPKVREAADRAIQRYE